MFLSGRVALTPKGPLKGPLWLLAWSPSGVIEPDEIVEGTSNLVYLMTVIFLVALNSGVTMRTR